jgi:hypothetical protein
MARHGGPLPSTARMSGMSAAAHSGKVMAGTQRANGSAQRAHPAAANPQALTPTVMANNAVAEHKKPPSTQPVHQALVALDLVIAMKRVPARSGCAPCRRRKERREPHGGVRLASPTAQEMASDAPILHWRGAPFRPGIIPKLSLRVLFSCPTPR